MHFGKWRNAKIGSSDHLLEKKNFFFLQWGVLKQAVGLDNQKIIYK